MQIKDSFVQCLMSICSREQKRRNWRIESQIAKEKEIFVFFIDTRLMSDLDAI